MSGVNYENGYECYLTRGETFVDYGRFHRICEKWQRSILRVIANNKREKQLDENNDKLVANRNRNDAVFDCKCYESVCVCDKSVSVCPNGCEHDDFWYPCTCKCVYCVINYYK